MAGVGGAAFGFPAHVQAAVRPSGAGYTPYEGLPDKGRLSTTCNAVPGRTKITFLPGVYSYRNFADGPEPTLYGALMWTKVGGLCGSGVDSTIIEMAPQSSTQAGLIPEQTDITPTGAPNPLHLVRVANGSDSATFGCELSGFTLRGTPQPIDPKTGKPHCYGGLIIYRGAMATMTDVKITGIPGLASFPPGETVGISDYRSSGTALTRVEVDGRDSTGRRVGASGIGLSRTHGFRTVDTSSHDNCYGSGVTHYLATGAISHRRLRVEGNRLPLNFERNVCTVDLVDCVVRGNRSRTSTGVMSPIFMVLDSDLGSSKVRIQDPVIDGGAPTPKNPVCVMIHPTYWGSPQRQVASDVRLYLAGVERPDCLRIVSRYRNLDADKYLGRRENSAEGGTPGVSVSPANSGGASGSSWSAVLLGSGSSIKYAGAVGAKTYRIASAGSNAALLWEGYVGPFLSTRFAIALSAYPKTVVFCAAMYGNGGYAAHALIDSYGRLRIDDKNGSLGVTKNPIPLNTWITVRLLAELGTSSSTGRILADVHPAGAATTETFLSGQANTGGGGTNSIIKNVQFGMVGSPGEAIAYRLDRLAADDQYAGLLPS